MTALHETFILDPRRFNPETRKWNVPILNVKGLKAINLYINGELIDHGNYSVSNNFLALGNSVEVIEGSSVSLMIEYSESGLLLVFWLPIILAIIGLIGTLAQPVLFNLGLIYQPKMTIAKYAWGYDFQKHQFIMKLRTKNLTSEDKKKWQVYMGVRKRDESIDVQRHAYQYFVGPFNLTDQMHLIVPLDLAFSCNVAREKTAVQGAVFLVERNATVIKPFIAENHSKYAQFMTSASDTIPEGLSPPDDCN